MEHQGRGKGNWCHFSRLGKELAMSCSNQGRLHAGDGPGGKSFEWTIMVTVSVIRTVLIKDPLTTIGKTRCTNVTQTCGM